MFNDEHILQIFSNFINHYNFLINKDIQFRSKHIKHKAYFPYVEANHFPIEGEEEISR